MARGVRPGDRVAVLVIHRHGRDPLRHLTLWRRVHPGRSGPAAGRNAYIMNDCAVALAFVERRLEEAAP